MPRMKRLLWATFWLFWVAMIGASLTRDWLGFWPSMLIFGVLMAAVLTPLAFASLCCKARTQCTGTSPRVIGSVGECITSVWYVARHAAECSKPEGPHASNARDREKQYSHSQRVARSGFGLLDE